MSIKKDAAISVNGIHKSFKLPHEQHSGLKQLVINLAKRKKGYENQHVLKGIDFEIEKGDFFGIVGRNGSGKSTLLKIIAGIYTPDQGYVKTNGTLTPFIELGVGFNPELTGRENVFLNGALLGFSRKEMETMYDKIVEFAELERFMDQKLKNYSSGMQVRLAFSIAIRAESDILVLDEVLAVGDSAFQQKCYDYFERMKSEKKTIILVTHSMDAVKRFCDKALLIEKGSIKLMGKPQEIADQYLLDNINTNKKPTTQTRILTKNVSELGLKRVSPKNLSRNDSLIFEFNYMLNDSIEPALAFTISKDGISIAEMNTIHYEIPNEINVKYKVKFSTKLEMFNPGVYKIDIALIERNNQSVQAYHQKIDEFIIEGIDKTRGGAIRVEDGWEIC